VNPSGQAGKSGLIAPLPEMLNHFLGMQFIWNIWNSLEEGLQWIQNCAEDESISHKEQSCFPTGQHVSSMCSCINKN